MATQFLYVSLSFFQITLPVHGKSKFWVSLFWHILTPKSPSRPLSWIRSRPFLCSSHFSVQTECDSKPYSLLFTDRCDRRIYHTAGGWVDLFYTLHAAAWKTRSVPFAMFYWFYCTDMTSKILLGVAQWEEHWRERYGFVDAVAFLSLITFRHCGSYKEDVLFVVRCKRDFVGVDVNSQ